MKQLKAIKFLLTVIFAAAICLSSCSSIWVGTVVPRSSPYVAFENDTWLVIDSHLINKTDGTAFALISNFESIIHKNYSVYAGEDKYDYRYEFEDSKITRYTFLQASAYESKDDIVDYFFDCVITYGYDGKEIERSYSDKALTREEMEAIYMSYPDATEAFSYKIDALWQYNKDEDRGDSEKAITEYAEKIYENGNKLSCTVMGAAKPKGGEMQFSLVVSDAVHYNSSQPLLEGIHRSEIVRYDPESGEFETVMSYGKRGEMIVDFDEDGLYVFDSDNNLKYYDLKTEKTTVIYKFKGNVHYFNVSDGYIGVYYSDNKSGRYYLVYQKGGDVIANFLRSEYVR